ncbi:MAG: aminoglycoside phosphotransferase family protein [Kiloniellaceae bacterium]
MTERGRLIADFLAAAGWGDAARRPLAGDASFRRYERLTRDEASAVLMDAPPPKENVRAFHGVAQRLLALGLSAPRPLEVDAAAGLMLLEDFGDRTFTRVLAEGAAEAPLYRLATDVLIALHRRWRPDAAVVGANPGAGLPPYDDARLTDEATLLPDWTLPALRGKPTPADLRESYVRAWLEVFPIARAVPDCLVLRDYHVDNLMLLEGRGDVAACGLLDFQDAVLGPVSYDVVSLLEDARRDVSPAVVAEMLERYLAAFPGLDRQAFIASYAVLGAQRAAKIIGIFTRLSRRDGKSQYLQHIPRVWRLLEAGLANPALSPVKDWFDREVPPPERVMPPAADQR